MNSKEQRQQAARLDRRVRQGQQIATLNELLGQILPGNRFYQTKLADCLAGMPSQVKSPQLKSVFLESAAELAHLPYTFKAELQQDFRPVAQPSDAGAILPANLTYSLDRYVRYHQTSGTSGRPLVVMDTADDWRWWSEAWQFVLDAAEIEPGDRAVLAFSFGPFIGFWSAFDALVQRGVMAIPAGGLSSVARLQLLRTTSADTIFCTPSYALHLAEVGREHQLVVADLPVKKIVVAGEPGGSVPAIRQTIESNWNAKLIDHCGASEVGPWGFNSPDGTGLFVNEHHFIAEFRSIERDAPAHEGELSELVLTSLGRAGAPVIRYRTGDLVRPIYSHEYENTWVYLRGGVLGRVDDMLIIRGVNIFPSSIEQILRSFPEVVEYRMTAFKQGHLDFLKIEVEDRMEQPKRISQELMVRLNLKVEVVTVPIGSLPRYEMKGRRFQDLRHTSDSTR
ncbi:MAG: phenylacetate--CoA ligase family protein [Planctomycetaceae bacterium]|nr:phenylacetate--CoA ligase family protein [Planctomycetaceae bacterium]